MRVAVIGNGGREHALRHALSRTATLVPPDDDADLYVVGPEQPLVDGVADRLRAEGKPVFGPGADGARLEGSKGWMKEVLDAAGVPTARHATVDSVEAAAEFLHSLDGLYVVKTDYLAAGKGVLVTTDYDEALADAAAKLASGVVVLEEGMSGPELSVLAVCNGKDFVLLPPARDHKRVGDGDTGP
ncbi:MAG TPA: phosphoribosylamine--glycine ligase, partial [Acidimicrobiales bacterium]